MKNLYTQMCIVSIGPNKITIQWNSLQRIPKLTLGFNQDLSCEIKVMEPKL